MSKSLCDVLAGQSALSQLRRRVLIGECSSRRRLPVRSPTRELVNLCTKPAMGGGDSYHPHGHHTYKQVWTPSGGWWCDPKGWRRNTAFAMGIYLAAQYFIFSYSAENERRYQYPVRWVPGMVYAKHFPKPPEEATE